MSLNIVRKKIHGTIVFKRSACLCVWDAPVQHVEPKRWGGPRTPGKTPDERKTARVPPLCLCQPNSAILVRKLNNQSEVALVQGITGFIS